MTTPHTHRNRPGRVGKRAGQRVPSPSSAHIEGGCIRLFSWGEGSLKPHCHSADLPATEHGTGVMLAYTVLSATHVPDCCQRGYRRCTSQGRQSRRLAAKRHSLVVKCTQKQQLPQLKADRPQNWTIGGHDPAQHSLLESGELTRNR